MSSFFKNNNDAPRAGVLFIALMIASLLIFVVYVREGSTGMLHNIQQSFGAIATPISSVGQSVSNSAENLSLAARDATADPSTLSGLQQENEELRNAVSQLEEYKQQAQRLEGLLNLRDTYSIEGVTARVIGSSSEAYSQTLTLDVGSQDGVDVGQTVMGSSGVIGQVVSVTSSSCTVRRLSDPASGCAAMIQSNRAQGIVRGSLEGLLYLKNLDAGVEVNVGDTIITSGTGGSYIQGLLVGQVVSIDATQGGADRTIVISQNATQTNSVSEVIVIRSAIAPTYSGSSSGSDSNGGNDNNNNNSNSNDSNS